MNNLKTIILLLLLTMTLLIVMSGVNCRDPHDFEPDIDTLLDPPAPPELLSPESAYVYMATTYPYFYIYVDFSWTEVSGAEEYSLEVTVDTFAPVIYPTTDQAWTIIIMDTYRLCDYSWRVRAYSAAWKFYTEWSETWTFEARRQPDGPELVYPSNNQQFMIDSLPEAVDLGWRSIYDEDYYEIAVGKAFDTLSQVYANDTFSTFLAETTGIFWWQVKAGNPMWQCESKWSDKRYFIVEIR